MASTSPGADRGSGGYRTLAYVWDAATGKQVREVWVLQNFSIRTRLSGDGKILATFGTDGRERKNTAIIQLWDVSTGKELHQLHAEEEESQPLAAAFAPDGKTLVSASPSTGLVVWDVATGKELRRFTGRRGMCASVEFSPDGKRLAAAGFWGAVQVWDPAGKRVAVHDGLPNASVGFTDDGRVLAWGHNGHAIEVWDVLAEKSLTPPRGPDTPVSAVRFTADGKRFVTVAADCARALLGHGGGAGDPTLRLARHQRADLSAAPIRRMGMLLSPDGKQVLCGGSRLFELARGGRYARSGRSRTTGTTARRRSGPTATV